ncbi:hypothetical protein WR164_00950 [Philodulcilactobacillus myokoensis]|uniref:Uncharacterized protein n=1 Tax=Philodulcilactobacillus myokoensis TaxID=2929573 RepID=A0A9W6EQM4_9LACO|nr:hypothetical protein [Philodulcilactobacillus myokoensis]GLB46116.1 hypothetical protein WR164_00950 [Philodulcilactobacillus myokoensis]
MTIKDMKKILLNYVAYDIPVIGLIVSLLAIFFFVFIKGGNLLSVRLYLFLPLIVSDAIAMPFWIFNLIKN